jgi:hypothetical protein
LVICVLLEVSCERNRCLEVVLLTGLISTNEKDDEFAIPLGVVNEVSRPNINLQLGDTFRQLAVLIRIATRDLVAPHLHARGTAIEALDPIAVDLSDLDAYPAIQPMGYGQSTPAFLLCPTPQ